MHSDKHPSTSKCVYVTSFLGTLATGFTGIVCFFGEYLWTEGLVLLLFVPLFLLVTFGQKRGNPSLFVPYLVIGVILLVYVSFVCLVVTIIAYNVPDSKHPIEEFKKTVLIFSAFILDSFVLLSACLYCIILRAYKVYTRMPINYATQ
ncbi:hypothetical protein niasHT_037470 [Heterodera trifolii]|uniref:MARVEL domain-containing protein n=1 Tax=Heterodera trifolii TaxID=157864 RepID=A0ABD2ISB4_9BILA